MGSQPGNVDDHSKLPTEVSVQRKGKKRGGKVKKCEVVKSERGIKEKRNLFMLYMCTVIVIYVLYILV